MTQPDPANKFHLLWFSTQRGISNEDGEKSRVYYGKVFRVPRDIATEDARLAIEAREMNDLEERAINQSCTEGGKPAHGEFLERYDVFDIETGDALVMYRVPYQSENEKPIRPATVPPPLSRRARRAAASQGDVTGHLLPAPPNASDEARVFIGRILRLVDKHAAFKMPADIAAEQRALALMTVAAHELASVSDSTHKRAIISQMGMFLRRLVEQHDQAPEMPPLDKDMLEELEAEGIAQVIDLGPDDEPKSH